MIDIQQCDPARVQRAQDILRDAGQWAKVRRNGRPLFYGVPSGDPETPNRRYLTNTEWCDCPDARERGAVCKHRIAVALHVARLRREAAEGARS